MGKRLACLLISRALLDDVIASAFGSFNPHHQDECYACYLHRLGLENLASALGFPGEVKIVAVSESLHFADGAVAVRLESPDFRDVPQDCATPRVEAVYNKDGFSHWGHDAALVSDYVRHCDRPGYRPRSRWWLKPDDGGTWRDRPAML